MPRIDRCHTMEKEIGRRVRAARCQAGMSQARLGEHLGLTFQQIQKYENGSNRISASALVRLAKVLGTTPGELLAGLGEDDESAPRPVTNRQAIECARLVEAMPPKARIGAVQTLHAIAMAFRPAGVAA
ncbi:transcriptional regulator with XRE-family HTH domain [Ancylobacter sp. 3268]|uniref:helix-turn-helix domain-containing protein n=1 Tax=Ancylobacter sp. 3268 TaxID=2817752 RepID=UPI00285ECE81|nr:helix-turn-helix transcriptional regulator [Ancylobacter sp. 3268]MDR6953826.1 transcriptional regulator with XRE-family HTH domain [Ancylobacter sp. 3268]